MVVSTFSRLIEITQNLFLPRIVFNNTMYIIHLFIYFQFLPQLSFHYPQLKNM